MALFGNTKFISRMVLTYDLIYDSIILASVMARKRLCALYG